MTRIQWRLNEPIEANSQRWTKVHVLEGASDDVTLCGIAVPDAYDQCRDEWIPDAALRCKRCEKKAVAL